MLMTSLGNGQRAAQIAFVAILAANLMACRKSDVTLEQGQTGQAETDGKTSQSVNDSDGQDGNQPGPDLSPDQVVQRQLEAFQNNAENDAGIATAYRFASPDYRKQTGTVMRFAAIVRTPDFQALLGFQTAELGQLTIDDDRAMQVVLLEDDQGNVDLFLFELVKMRDGPLEGCWLTDGIHPSSLAAG